MRNLKHRVIICEILLSISALTFSQSASTTNSWQFMSPGGGNVVQIAGNEKALMVLTANNGFFISYNMGESWNKANTGLNYKWGWLRYNRDANLVAANGKFLIFIEDSLYFTDAAKIKWSSLAGRPEPFVNNLYSTGQDILAKTSPGIVILNQEQKRWDIINAPAEYGNLSVFGNLLIYCADEVYRSEDLGKNWTNTGHYAEGVVTFKDKLYSFYGSDWFVSADKGKKWKKTDILFPECERFYSTNQMLFFMRNDTTFFRNSAKGKWTVLPVKVRSYDADILSFGTLTFIPSVYEGLKVTEDNGRTWSQRNNGLNILNASKISFQNDSVFILSDSIVYASGEGGKKWDRIKKGNHIVFPDDTIVYKSQNNGISWIIEREGELNTADQEGNSAEDLMLQIIDGVLQISYYTLIRPFGDSLDVNSGIVRDSDIYLCTREGVYYKPVSQLSEEHIFDFFRGGWDLRGGSIFDLEIRKDNIYYKALAESKDQDGSREIYQYSCGEYYRDSVGNTIERTPQLTYKTEKVFLMNEIDTSLVFKGFEINGGRLIIDGNSIPIQEVYVLRNNCVDRTLQNIFLINFKYLIMKLNNEYYLVIKNRSPLYWNEF